MTPARGREARLALPSRGYQPPMKGDCFEEIEGAFKRVAAALNEARVEFMLGGSLAAWVRGGPESCNDLDLLLRERDAERALEALEGAGMRTERPPEGWLVKAWDSEVLVDLICHPLGIPIDDEVFERAEEVSAWGVPVQAMALEDVMTTKLLALQEHSLDYESLIQVARSLREKIDWGEVRRRTVSSPYARAFFALLEELDLVAARGPRSASGYPHIRVASSEG
jgi:predicted nucleotidyltransferase